MGACESNRHLLDDGAMMLRVLALSLTLISGFAQATVLQRPISLDTGTGELFGSLLLPKSDDPVPVVLIISGSGPTDRDGNNTDGGRNDSLKRLAWVLAKHNIASVRYDKRGVAASLAATPDERNLSVEAYVADAEAWGRAYRARIRQHRAELQELTRRRGWTFTIHRTDRPASEAALRLVTLVSASRGYAMGGR